MCYPCIILVECVLVGHYSWSALGRLRCRRGSVPRARDTVDALCGVVVDHIPGFMHAGHMRGALEPGTGPARKGELHMHHWRLYTSGRVVSARGAVLLQLLRRRRAQRRGMDRGSHLGRVQLRYLQNNAAETIYRVRHACVGCSRV